MNDLTEGKPVKLIFTFALPLMLGNLLQQLYITCDTMIVGKFVGVEALASLGAGDWIAWAALSIVMGFTQGFAIRISQCMGAKDYRSMKKSLIHNFILCIMISLAVTFSFQLCLIPLLKLLDTPDNIINGTILYLRIILAGNIIITFYNCFSSILRALGNSKTPLQAMIVASVINIILDLFFVCLLHTGIGGAALATVIAQCISALFCLSVLIRELPFTFHRYDLVIDKEQFLDLLKLGFPLAFQNAIIASGGIVLQGIVNSFGFLFVAGYTATNKLWGLLEIAATSYGYAITTYTSQNYGAKDFKRIRQGVFEGALLSITTSVIISALLLLCGKYLISMFISASPKQTATVMKIAITYLKIMAYNLPILYILYVYRSALQGMENTVLPMTSGFIELSMRLIVAFGLSEVIGSNAIFIAEISAWWGAGVFLYICYKIIYHKKSTEI